MKESPIEQTALQTVENADKETKEIGAQLNQLFAKELSSWKERYFRPETQEILNHFLQIQAKIQDGDFYKPITHPFYAFNDTAYGFLFDRFRLSSKSAEESKQKNRSVESENKDLAREQTTLQLMEKVDPPSLEYFMNTRKLHGNIQTAINITEEIALSLSIEKMPGSENNINWPDYVMELKIIDKNGEVLHDFQQDISSKTKFLAWHKDEANVDRKWIHVGIFQKQGFYNKGNWVERLPDEGIFALCHEIGHNQQLQDSLFIEKAKKLEGENFQPNYSPLAERDAWARAVKLLRSIHTRDGERVFTIKVNKKLKETITACLSTRGDETFKRGYKKDKTSIK